jgi:carnitine-CoA ligase
MPNPIRLGDFTAEWSTLPELLDARADEPGADRPVIEIDGRFTSYSDLRACARRIAANLHAAGVGKGDYVACLLPNSMDGLRLWFGVNLLGAVWVPINSGLIGEDLAYTVRDAAPKVFVVAADLAERLVGVGPLPFECRILVSGGDAHAPDAFERLLDDAPAAPAVALRPNDPAVIIYTGGTTGLPKGAVLPHFAWIAAGYRYIEAFRVTKEDRQMSVMTMFHVGGLGFGIIGPMVAGIPSHLEKRFSGSNFWARVRATGATLIDPLGTMVSKLLQNAPHPDDRNHRVRAMLGGVASLPPQTRGLFLERFGIEMVGVYALTECGGILIVNNPIGSPRPEANGKAWDWADIAILDDNDIPQAPGMVGQIALRPKRPNIFMLGYHNNPVRTLDTLRNFWLRTGDLGYLDEDGWLFFTGRQAHWMRRRGENISAYEIEGILSRLEGVREVIACGVPSEMGEDEVKVFIIPDGRAIEPMDVIRFCETRMAAFKVPRFVEFVDDFPRTVTKQEIERQKLAKMSNDLAWDRERVVAAS